MSIKFALVATGKNRRFLTWMLTGMIVYLIPVVIRYATGSIIIPFFNWPGYWIGHVIPGNLSEKILVNMFFPGAAGAIAGEVFIGHHFRQTLNIKTKYLSRFAGAMFFVSAWSLFQFWGYQLAIYMPFSPGSNLFESYFVFPLNYAIAACSIFTPTIIYSIKNFIRQHNH